MFLRPFAANAMLPMYIRRCRGKRGRKRERERDRERSSIKLRSLTLEKVNFSPMMKSCWL